MVNRALPLTVGNGDMTIARIIYYGNYNALDPKLLIATASGKAFVLGISMNGGYIGGTKLPPNITICLVLYLTFFSFAGFVFPMLTIGAMLGVVTNYLYPYVPLVLSTSCFMAAIPAAMVPMPFTLSLLAIFVFSLGDNIYVFSPSVYVEITFIVTSN